MIEIFLESDGITSNNFIVFNNRELFNLSKMKKKKQTRI